MNIYGVGYSPTSFLVRMVQILAYYSSAFAENLRIKDELNVRLISKEEAMMLRKNGFGNKVFSSHTKNKKYYVEERTKAEKTILRHRENRIVK